MVLVATRPTPALSMIESVEQGLKPYQPNHRMRPPMTRDGEIVRQHRAAAVTLELATEPRPKHDGAGDGDPAADRVHDGRTREVVEVHSEARQEVTFADPWWRGSHRDPSTSGQRSDR